jgi:cell division protein FtsB
MSVNEQIESLHNKIQHLSLNNASLLGEVARLESDILSLKGKKPKK